MSSLLALVFATFVLGLLFGSFANVLISRLPSGESIVRPRSHCPACATTIRWHDNIPLLSWFLLRARCSSCGAPISMRYPLVELATGVWFAAVAALALRSPLLAVHAPLSGDAILSLGLFGVALATLGVLLISLLVIDWQQHLLPDALTFPGILFGFLFTCAQAALLPSGAYDIHFDPRRSLRLRSPGSFVARGDVFLTGTERLIFGRVVAILAAALILLVVRWIYQLVRRREGLGLGDAKLLAMIAAFLGIWAAVLSLFLGTLAAALYGAVLLGRRRAHAGTALPFGSFLAGGGLAAALFGPAVIAWYRALL